MDSDDALHHFNEETGCQKPPVHMTSDEALHHVERYLKPPLKDGERDLFRGIWDRKDYHQIYKESFQNRCGLPHLRSNIAGGLWKKLRPVLGKSVNKSTLRGAVETAIQRWQQESMLSQAADPYKAEQPESEPPKSTKDVKQSKGPREGKRDSHPSGLASKTSASRSEDPVLLPILDWNDSPDVTSFCGRDRILKESDQQIRVNRCQLFTICGEAGVGKTWFAKQLALELIDQYQRIAWITFPRESPAPSLESLLAGLLQTLCQNFPPRNSKLSSPITIAEFVNFLMDYPSLIVFDQFETLLQAGVDDGSYQSGYESYGELLSQLGQRSHRSCIVLTSREKPNETLTAPGQHLVQEKHLTGFELLEAEEFLTTWGYGNESPATWRRLTQRCNGNPKALRAIASWIKEAHLDDIEDFLSDPESFPTEIMDEQQAQFQRLSPLEQEIIYQLCQEDSPRLTAKTLREMKIVGTGSRQNAQRSLLRRSLLFRGKERSHGYQVSLLMQQYIRQNTQN